MYILPKLQCINRGGCRMVAKNSKVPKFRNFGVLTGFGVSPGNPVHLVIFVKSILDFYAKCNQIAPHELYNELEFQETFYTNSTLILSKK